MMNTKVQRWGKEMIESLEREQKQRRSNLGSLLTA